MIISFQPSIVWWWFGAKVLQMNGRDAGGQCLIFGYGNVINIRFAIFGSRLHSNLQKFMEISIKSTTIVCVATFLLLNRKNNAQSTPL